MDELVRDGKIRHWGVSEWTPQQMREALELCRANRLAGPETDQPRYSMLDRAAEEEVLPACAELGLGVVVFSPLAQGMLTGKYRAGQPPPAGSRATSDEGGRFVERFFTPENYRRVERVRAIADAAGLPPSQLAIAWVLRRSEVSSAIVGATSAAQVEQNAAAGDARLSGDVLRAVEDALGER
jgi:aryl-alcohol dehydrogenase-like predicted oxidoreductase